MATVSFCVPEEVKQAFDKAFERHDKSAIIAGLMRDAVTRHQRRQRHHEAVERILVERANAPLVSEAMFASERQGARS